MILSRVNLTKTTSLIPLNTNLKKAIIPFNTNVKKALIPFNNNVKKSLIPLKPIVNNSKTLFNINYKIKNNKKFIGFIVINSFMYINLYTYIYINNIVLLFTS